MGDILKDLGELFLKGFVEDEVEISGFKFKLRTLDEQESIWRDKYTDLSMNTSFLSSRRVPTLAISIREINGKKVKDIVDISEEEKKKYEDKEDNYKYLVAEKVKDFLLEAPPSFIDKLWSKYQELESRSSTFLGDIKDPEFFRKEGKGKSPSNDETGSDEANESAPNGGESRQAL